MISLRDKYQRTQQVRFSLACYRQNKQAVNSISNIGYRMSKNVCGRISSSKYQVEQKKKTEDTL
jgi:hypothetical protein